MTATTATLAPYHDPRGKKRPWTVTVPTTIGFRHERFATEAEAQAFIDGGCQIQPAPVPSPTAAQTFIDLARAKRAA